MDDFEIEILDSNDSDPDEVQLPVNFISVGATESDDTKVYIKQDVYKALEKYAAADVHHERGTIILGDFCEDLGKIHVVISDYIEAKYTDASASTLTFTHKTWDYVHKKHDSDYPDRKIVGWQHTHPGYGIFLSNYDLFIHENFFDLPFQVAYVIDPVQKLRGFFQWKKGKIEKLKGYYIYDDIGKPIEIGSEKKKPEPEKKEEEKPAAKSSLPAKLLLGILTIAVALLAVNSVVMLNKFNSMTQRYDEQAATNDSLTKQVAQQEDTIKQQAAEIADLQEQIISAVAEDDRKMTAKDLLDKIESGEIVVRDKEKAEKQLREVIDKEDDKPENTVTYIVHTVKSGESLADICDSYGIDYDSYSKTILGMNGIYNANYIYVGQKLILPVV